jgi:hypothetical protein
MPRPATTPLGEAVYARLGPVAVQDETLGWPLLTLVQGLAEMARQVEDLVRPADIARHTWDPLLDVDLSPDWNLPYLGQFVGVRVTPGATPVQARAQIKAEGGFQRGTPAAMVAAVRATLVGSQYVFLRERDGDEDHITVVTRTADTPAPAVTLAAAVSQKAAGLILAHIVTSVRTYVENTTLAPTYAARSATYANYAASRGF